MTEVAILNSDPGVPCVANGHVSLYIGDKLAFSVDNVSTTAALSYPTATNALRQLGCASHERECLLLCVCNLEVRHYFTHRASKILTISLSQLLWWWRHLVGEQRSDKLLSQLSGVSDPLQRDPTLNLIK